MLTPLHDERRYHCPGELGEVSRSVHLARLAASYGKCATCPQRVETGALRIHAFRQNRSQKPDFEGMVRTAWGYRGVYVNQLNRNEAIAWAAAFAAILWEDEPPPATFGKRPEWSGASTVESGILRRRGRPTVVIGYDERPPSPEILTGVALGLKRMSCQVIDIGLTTSPCLAFAVHHLLADAGVYVTGGGCEPGWTGFDIRLRHGLPPDERLLERWRAARGRPLSRPSRSSGSLRAFPASIPYEANLWKHFHALRPLRVVCGTSSRHLARRLEQLFQRLPGDVHVIPLPVRRRNLSDPSDSDVERVGGAVRQKSAHFGMVIDDDAATSGLLDERGGLVPRWLFQELILRQMLHEHGPGKVLVQQSAGEEFPGGSKKWGGQIVLATEADLAARLMDEEALIALGTEGRVWFGGDVPACDALLTLAVVMQALSQSDAETTQVLERLSSSLAGETAPPIEPVIDSRPS